MALAGFAVILFSSSCNVRLGEPKLWEAYPPAAGLERNDAGAKHKILFIGNSLLYWRNGVKMFADLATSAGAGPMKVGYVYGNNYRLDDFLQEGTAMKMIRQHGPWDYVVLFEGSAIAGNEPDRLEQNYSVFDKVIRQVGATPVLVETYVDDPKYWWQSYKGFFQVADKYHVPVIPLASAWEYVRANHSDVPLYWTDNHHPSLQGTFLECCMFYGCLMETSPLRLSGKLSYKDRGSYGPDVSDQTDIIFSKDADRIAVETAAAKVILMHVFDRQSAFGLRTEKYGDGDYMEAVQQLTAKTE